MDIDYGTGLTATCVLTPPFNCNGRKYKSNYISKFVENTDENKPLIDNEIRISKYLAKKINKNILEKYFAVVLDSCVVNSNKIQRCKLKPKTDYKVLYSKNGSCKPITKKASIFVKNSNQQKKIKVNSIKNNKVLSRGQLYSKNDIIRKCGVLYEPHLIDFCFSKKNRQKNIKRLLNMLKLLKNNGCIQLDIKLENLVVNIKKEIRLIDFGGSIIYRDLSYLRNNTDFLNIINKLFSNNILAWTEYYLAPEILILSEFYNNINIEQMEMFATIKTKLEEIYDFDIIKIRELSDLIGYIYDNKMEFINSLFFNNKESKIYNIDVYAMGISLFSIYEHIHKQEENEDFSSLEELINNMITIDYRERINIKDCFKSSYFR
jgi:serine/threonine protein kinase